MAFNAKSLFPMLLIVLLAFAAVDFAFRQSMGFPMPIDGGRAAAMCADAGGSLLAGVANATGFLGDLADRIGLAFGG